MVTMGARRSEMDARFGRVLATLMLLEWAWSGFAIPAFAATPTCLGPPATIVGTDPHGQLIMGTDRNDVVVGSPGPDTIYLLGGADANCCTGAANPIPGSPTH